MMTGVKTLLMEEEKGELEGTAGHARQPLPVILRHSHGQCVRVRETVQHKMFLAVVFHSSQVCVCVCLHVVWTEGTRRAGG